MLLVVFWLPISICLVAGVCFLIFGVRGLVEQKPRVVSARPLRWALLVTCVPNVGIALYRLFPLSGTRLAVSFLSFVVVLPVLWLVFVTWNRLNRYLVFGVTETAFRRALDHALNTLGMPFEEGETRMRLTAIDVDLEIAVNPSGAMVQLRSREDEHKVLLKRIVESMTWYWEMFPEKTVLQTYTLCTILGVLLVVVGGFLVLIM